MLFKKIFIFSAILFLFVNGFAQNHELDSLKARLGAVHEDTSKVMLLNEIALAYNRVNPDTSIEYSKRSLALSERLGFSRGSGYAFGHMGMALQNKGDYPSALENFFKAFRSSEEDHDDGRKAASYNNIGLTYAYMGEMAKAKENYFKALDLFEISRHESGAASALVNIGSAYFAEQKYDEALIYFKKAYERLKKMSSQEKVIADCLNNIGVIHYVKREFSVAIKFYELALEYQQKINDRYGVSMCYLNLGQTAGENNEKKDAFLYLQKGLQIAKEINALPLLRDGYYMLFETARRFNDPSVALGAHVEYTRYKDSISNVDLSKRIARSEAQFEYEKKEQILKLEQEKKQTLAEAESHRQKIIIYAISGVLILVLILAVVILKSLHLNRQKNKIITKQKEVVEAKQKEILDSIHYAKRIQQALLTKEKYFLRYLKK